jgi:hypothetical protein
LQSISLRRKNFVQQQLLLQYIQIFSRRGTRLISRSILLVLDSGDAGPCDWKPGCTRAYFYDRQELHLFGSPFYRQFVLALAVPSRLHLQGRIQQKLCISIGCRGTSVSKSFV